ncbi:SRPBCC family protein [Microbacterium sp. SMR1]|uniref:SRPBCC family protein n=1 Tax=Microbacterium sp. SMR1 TaxID=1497340 RepID=UPI000DCC3586|nr:SRPBCC family protein [Microbacterium sp. SMR1]RAZ34469.1 hypothetical protein DO944_01065 [Microbacterium sp. SMR1]
MTSLTATREMRADPQTIADVILDISALADWNPALHRTDTRDRRARIGHPYSVSTRVPGRATLAYLEASPDRIVWTLKVAGGSEIGEWSLQPTGATTRVTHRMVHEGPLFMLMRHAMAPVPDLRLDRLQARAEHYQGFRR